MNFFFVSADMHWPLYEATRRGLSDLLARGRGVRAEIVVAGVCYPTQPEFCTFPFRELVDAVPGLGRLDVLLAGGAYGTEIGRRLPVYEEHRKEGYLGNRAIGVTFHDRAAAVTAVRGGDLDIAFLRYNADHVGAERDVFPGIPERPRPLLFNFKSTSGYVRPERMAELGLAAPDYWQPAITDHTGSPSCGPARRPARRAEVAERVLRRRPSNRARSRRRGVLPRRRLASHGATHA